MAWIEKGKKALYVCYTTNERTEKGKKKIVKIPAGRRKADAEKLRIRIEHEQYVQSTGLLDIQDIPLKELSNRYMNLRLGERREHTLATDKNALKHFLGHVGDVLVSQVTVYAAQEYQAWRSRQVKPSTVHREIAVIRCMFNRAVEWSFVLRNPWDRVARVKVPEKRIKVLTQDEITDLFAKVRGTRLEAPIATALLTGLRRSELAQLEWGDIHADKGYIEVVNKDSHGTTKTGRNRILPYPELLRRIMEPLRQPAGPCFANLDGDSMTADALRKVLTRMITKKGLPVSGWHVLRHTFASLKMMADVHPRKIQAWLGHSTMRMTERYMHLLPFSTQDPDINRGVGAEMGSAILGTGTEGKEKSERADKAASA